MKRQSTRAITDRRRWTRERLYQLVREKLGDRLFLVVSNREPYIHSTSGDRIVCQRPVSGLTEALDPVMLASRGTWVAHGSGDADRKVVDTHNRVAVPPEKPEYTLRRVWLTEEEVAGFYLGFSNEGLWPLCHVTFTPPVFRETDWAAYEKVNHIFAEAVLAEVGGRRAVVLVQDYHLALLPHLLKEKDPRLTVGQFWHIPWPAPDIFRTCPWREQVLKGLLGNDLLGFHIQSFCDNFNGTVKAELGLASRTTLVEPFPISVDFDRLNEDAESESVAAEMEDLRVKLNLTGKYVGIGTDRLDYTKGIPQKLQALDRFLEENPAYRGKVVLVQVGMPSRGQIQSYQDTAERIEMMINNLNNKYASDSWWPVTMMRGQLAPAQLIALRLLAHFCLVSSLHDGMNLVAKEFVASRPDNDGVLVLSEFTGAAAELRDALLINPFATGQFAAKLKEAIEMPKAERQRRMKAMRRIVAANNIYRWGASIVSRLISIAESR